MTASFSVVYVSKRGSDKILQCWMKAWGVGDLGTPQTNDTYMSLKSCVCRILSSLEMEIHKSGPSLLPEGMYS